MSPFKKEYLKNKILNDLDLLISIIADSNEEAKLYEISDKLKDVYIRSDYK